jgi:hypothetical protein
MIEGLLRHSTKAGIEANYTDTHGASLVGFAFTELLGFKLLPRLKNIGAIQLYSPDVIQVAGPKLEKVLKKRAITGGRHLFRACCIPERLPVLRSLGRPGSAGGVRHETSASGVARHRG